MKNKKAFTLIELIIYIGLFSTVLVVLTQIITSALNTQVESQSVSSVEQDSRYILARLNYDIPRATLIVHPNCYGTGACVDPNKNLQVTINSNPYIYSVDINGNLFLEYPSGTIQLNGFDSKISDFNLIKYETGSPGLDSVRIHFKITSRSTAKSGSQSRTFDTTIGLRNYN